MDMIQHIQSMARTVNGEVLAQAKKKARIKIRAMPIRQSGTWVGGENVPDTINIDLKAENL